MQSDGRPSVELEATLVVCATDPEKVVAEIANLTSLADFRLKETHALRMRDIYFDTVDSALRERGWGLRVRTIGSNQWLTFKGSATATQWGAVAYTEMEWEWSGEAFSKVLMELGKIGVSLTVMHEIFDYADPVATMKRLGLEIIQDRETFRQAREVFYKFAEEAYALAELVLDSVTYRFQGSDILHYELEIEARQPDACHSMVEIEEALFAIWGPVLRKWVHSKLATGWAIERLLGVGALQDAVHNRKLTSGAYDEIEAFFAGRG